MPPMDELMRSALSTARTAPARRIRSALETSPATPGGIAGVDRGPTTPGASLPAQSQGRANASARAQSVARPFGGTPPGPTPLQRSQAPAPFGISMVGHTPPVGDWNYEPQSDRSWKVYPPGVTAPASAPQGTLAQMASPELLSAMGQKLAALSTADPDEPRSGFEPWLSPPPGGFPRGAPAPDNPPLPGAGPDNPPLPGAGLDNPPFVPGPDVPGPAPGERPWYVPPPFAPAPGTPAPYVPAPGADLPPGYVPPVPVPPGPPAPYPYPYVEPPDTIPGVYMPGIPTMRTPHF